MRYYTVADVHGFYTPLMKALEECGYFTDRGEHKLVVCGDLMDRGEEALKLQEFILSLMEKDEVILIRGNHEDLFLDLVDNASNYLTLDGLKSHHYTNGTISSALQLTGYDIYQAIMSPVMFEAKAINTPFYNRIIPATRNYLETERYIFIHGWIPCTTLGEDTFIYDSNWREANTEQWERARWINGMKAWSHGVRENGKTIICGHWHTSYGHAVLEGRCTEFGADADFSPFTGDGILAIDSCTAYTGKVNCVVLED